MTFHYFGSFDLSRISPGSIELGTTGFPNIQLNLATLTYINGYLTYPSVFNHVITCNFLGLDRERTLLLGKMPFVTFYVAAAQALRTLATDAGWTNPTAITFGFNASTRKPTLAYSEGFTVISFSNAVGRRLFGLAANYSGPSVTSVTADQAASHTLAATLTGPSSMTPLLEDEPMSSMAYSGGGRVYALSRTGTVTRAQWIQQYEPQAKTFRRYAGAAPDEYTFQNLFEDCRAGTPFCTYDTDGSGVRDAWVFEAGQECFHPQAATPGNADQFHIPFNVIAMGTDP